MAKGINQGVQFVIIISACFSCYRKNVNQRFELINDIPIRNNCPKVEIQFKAYDKSINEYFRYVKTFRCYFNHINSKCARIICNILEN